MSTAETTTERPSPRHDSAAAAAAAAATAERDGRTLAAAERDGTAAAAAARNPSGRVFRGRSIAELIPRIEEELGAEAIVLRRHSGLEGGIAGFFQRPFVEIEAQPGGKRLDLYDGGPEVPPPAKTDRQAQPVAFQAVDLSSVLAPASGGERPSEHAFASALAAAGIDMQAAPTADIRSAHSPAPAPAPAASLPAAAGATKVPERTGAAVDAARSAAGTVDAARSAAVPPAPAAGMGAVAGDLAAQAGPQPAASPPPAVDPGSRTQRSVQRLLLEAGLGEAFADELIAEAKAHLLPFDPRGGLRRAVGLALQRRIASAAPLPRRGGLLALVGPGGSGKTRCVAALAGAYRSSGEMPVGCASILATPGQQSLKMLMSPRLHSPVDAGGPRALRAVARARGEGIALLDTPSLSPADGGAIRELARLLGEMAPDRVIVALPATLSGAAAAKLLTALRPLRADALAITHLDGADQIGVALEAACAFGLAPEFMLGSRRGQRVLEKADPATLAKRVLG